jgi:Tfp pilus assembly protein PilN
MNTMIAIDEACAYESASGARSDFGASPHRRGASRVPRCRYWIECVAAMSVGFVAAIVWAASGAGDDRFAARRVLLERQLAQLAPHLAQVTRLDRAAESARASDAVALTRARPYAALRSLLETLSGQADAGVTVNRVRQSREGFELQVRAVDSDACASWVARLTQTPGWEAAEITELRLVAAPVGGHAERAVEANVLLPSRAAQTASAPRRATPGSAREVRGGRSER